MTPEELIARAGMVIAAWNCRDIDQIVAAFHPEVQFRGDLRTDATGGREAVRLDAEALLRAVPDLELQPRRTFVAGNVLTQEWVGRGTRATARPGSNASREQVKLRGVLIADYDASGWIVAFVRYWGAASERPTARFGGANVALGQGVNVSPSGC
jgi:hypothetical protein